MSARRTAKPAARSAAKSKRPPRATEPEHTNAHPLEIGPDAFREMVELAAGRIADHLATLPEQPMHRNRGARKQARSLKEPIPERGAPFEKLLATLFDRVLPLGLNTASPGYLAYIPGGGLLHAPVADLVTSAINRYVGVWLAAPGVAQIEANAVDWLAEIAGMPAATRGGLLTTGGSMANLVALVTARRARFPRGFREAVVYASDQAHHSVTKAALVAGIADDRVRVIETDDGGRMRAPAVRRAIAADRDEGLEPFLVVANAGTTNTGAVDDLEGLAELAAAERVWLHVDAAYGGFFRMTERGRAALRGIERADSVTLDPHKGLFLPYGTGALVVRDAEALRAAHSISASYMPAMQSERDLVDFCEISPELSREARGVRVWLPMKMHGAGAFRDALDEKLDLARFAAAELARWPEIDLTHPPELSLLAFRVRPREPMNAESLEALQRRVLRGVNARQRVLLTSAVVKGRTVLRMCVLSFRTHEDRMRMALDDLRASIDEALASGAVDSTDDGHDLSDHGVDHARN